MPELSVFTVFFLIMKKQVSTLFPLIIHTMDNRLSYEYFFHYQAKFLFLCNQ